MYSLIFKNNLFDISYGDIGIFLAYDNTFVDRIVLIIPFYTLNIPAVGSLYKSILEILYHTR